MYVFVCGVGDFMEIKPRAHALFLVQRVSGPTTS